MAGPLSKAGHSVRDQVPNCGIRQFGRFRGSVMNTDQPGVSSVRNSPSSLSWPQPQPSFRPLPCGEECPPPFGRSITCPVERQRLAAGVSSSLDGRSTGPQSRFWTSFGIYRLPIGDMDDNLVVMDKKTILLIIIILILIIITIIYTIV
ncbi:Hypothetical protein CINCED_3A012737 [Cinara cedri]|uniref:Uncharacterized protein n=1 Tax=Cinara cedri TaxID=506608 RepID=A0A5E4MA30_9HEMI|nr:Hypothetical protein CINCED_3A012737 [Cinara cedri]